MFKRFSKLYIEARLENEKGRIINNSKTIKIFMGTNIDRRSWRTRS